MASDLLVDEDYASSEDSDFAPDNAPDQDMSGESGDEDDTDQTQRTIKRQHEGGRADDAGLENSGDEAVIGKGEKRRKKNAARGEQGEDEGGDGRLIQTRSQRAQQKIERKAVIVSGPVTIDVDAVWAQMLSGSSESAETNAEKTFDSSKDGVEGEPHETSPSSRIHGEAPGGSSHEMITIKRTYNFAGKVHTEEKLVPRDSAEGRLYLQSSGENADPTADPDAPPKRMPRKAFRSVFEPIVDQNPQRRDLNLGMLARMRAREQAAEDAKKLNTVEKSRMDWAGYVDKEGIKDELELAGRSKDSYAERQQFLARTEAKRDDDAKRAKLAGKVR